MKAVVIGGGLLGLEAARGLQSHGINVDVVHSGKAHYIGVSEWRAEEIRRGYELARELRIPFVSNQPQYNMLWRVIEEEVVEYPRKGGTLGFATVPARFTPVGSSAAASV